MIPKWYGQFNQSWIENYGESSEAQNSSGIIIHGERSGLEYYEGSTTNVLFEGYLLDRKELIQELEISHPEPSNAQLVAAAYNKWGVNIFQHIDGGYVIAICDVREKRFLLGNDALCMHPLFYTQDKRKIWFSSNPLMLVHHGPKIQEFNRLALATYLMPGKPPPGETGNSGIMRMQPGQFILTDNKAQIIRRIFWDPVPDPDEPYLADDYVINNFEPLLERAVARCLDVGANGVLLSGGIDSVVIAAIASGQRNINGLSPLLAIAGKTPPGYKPYSGEDVQEPVARHLGMIYSESNNYDWLEGREMIAASLEELGDFPAPSSNFWTSSYLGLYRQGPKHDVNVLLTGSGGDDWLGAGEPFAGDLFKSFRFAKLLQFIQSVRGTGGRPTMPVLRHLLWTYGLRLPFYTRFIKYAPDASGRYRRKKIDRFLPDWLAPDPRLREELIDYYFNSRNTWLDSEKNLVKSYYRASMAHFMKNPALVTENERDFFAQKNAGITLLSPFHDRRIVEFMFLVSPDVITYRNKYKGLLRPIVEKYLPEYGISNQTKSYPSEFDIFMNIALKNGIKQPWQSFDISKSHLSNMGIIDESKVINAFSDSKEKNMQQLAQMFTIISTENWLLAQGQ